MYLIVKRLFIIFSLSILLMCCCAKKESPTGGPKDTTAPKILFSQPLSGQMNLGQKPEIVIGFNERMKRSAIKSGIKWRPHFSDYATEWVGNNLHITPEDTLMSDQTYVISITGIKDYHDVVMDSIFTLAFSTGTILDSCLISGQIYHNDKPVASGIVRLFEESDTTGVPAYFTLSKKGGEYSLNYLKRMDYRLLVFKDDNKNDEFDFGQEAGLDTTISFDKRWSFTNFDVNLVVTDTTPPILESAQSINNTHLKITFSEEMNPVQLLSLKNYSVTDTINTPLEIFSLMPGDDDGKSVLFRTAPQIDSLYFVIADSTMTDLAGHKLGMENKQPFMAKDYPDTIAPRVKSFLPEHNALVQTVYPTITINFNEFMDKENCPKAFSLVETAHNKIINGEFTWKDETTMNFQLSDYLDWVVQYTVILDTLATDAAGNQLKEKIEWKFLTAPIKEE